MAINREAQILKEIDPNRVHFFTVKGIFKDGVKNRYEKNLQRWHLNHSTEIKIDGVLIGENDFYNSATAKTVETNKIDLNGVPLNESTFIEMQLKQSKQIFNKTLGSELNYDIHEETKAYIEYLEKRKKNINGIVSGSGVNIIGFKTSLTKPQQKKLFKALENKYIKCSEADFLAMFTDNPKPIEWRVSKTLLAYFVLNLPEILTAQRWKVASQIFYSSEFNKKNLQGVHNKAPFPKGWESLTQILKV